MKAVTVSLLEHSLLYREFLAEREEILRHKWLASEKAGRDVGWESALVTSTNLPISTTTPTTFYRLVYPWFGLVELVGCGRLGGSQPPADSPTDHQTL